MSTKSFFFLVLFACEKKWSDVYFDLCANYSVAILVIAIYIYVRIQFAKLLHMTTIHDGQHLNIHSRSLFEFNAIVSVFTLVQCVWMCERPFNVPLTFSGSNLLNSFCKVNGNSGAYILNKAKEFIDLNAKDLIGIAAQFK